MLEAIKNGQDQVASLLVKAGAELAIDDAGGFLCTTIARRDFDLLRRVLANGINPNSKNYDCRTPLHMAASEGLYSVAELLIEAGASILSKDRYDLILFLNTGEVFFFLNLYQLRSAKCEIVHLGSWYDLVYVWVDYVDGLNMVLYSCHPYFGITINKVWFS